uniref:Oxysterol-binding protein n=1 Tax=Phascolarctos cinereus TaxID=38626 RepID=A0A6P5KUT8_PHACI|nr:oxysterol-binding protein-related protein 10 isoform X2 [Phascolarctos cinereus]
MGSFHFAPSAHWLSCCQDGEKKKKKGGRWKRNVEEDVPSWPVGEEDVCSIPVYRDSVCPMQVHKEDVCPMLVGGKDLCLMQVSVEDVCPTIAFEKDVSLVPVVDENKTLMPAVDEDKTPMPAVDKDKSLIAVVDKDMTPRPAVDKGKAPRPAVDKDKTPRPSIDKDKSLIAVVDKDKSLIVVVDKDMTPRPAVDKGKAPRPAVDKDKTPRPAVDRDMTPRPSVDKDKSLIAVVDKDKTLMPVVDKDMTARPAVDKGKAPRPAVDRDMTPRPSVDKDKSLIAVVDKDKTLMPVVDKDMTLRPAVDKDKNPRPAVDKGKTPRPVAEEKVKGARESLSTRSQAWSAHQFPPELTSTSQHQVRPSPSVIQQEPKVESSLGSTLQDVRINEEETDNEENGEDVPGQPEDPHNVVVHLISQLQFGMDLTKVALPTFILEKRSLLEMFANFMAHPDMLLSIGSGATPAERAISFVEYYLTSFREGRKGTVAKKPYNPILGETFHCSWDIPKDRVKPLPRKRKAKAPVTDEPQSGRYKLTFVAEQVSHHPPVSCFYCECKEKGMFVNTYVWTKSKFMGMSIGVSLVGEGVLRLLDHGEDYVFTLPSAYARSILTIPWVELGGKVTMDCAKTGYTALVTFHTKPFYGGKIHRLSPPKMAEPCSRSPDVAQILVGRSLGSQELHGEGDDRVTAEVKHKPTNTIVCKAQGEWNGILEFTYSSGETKLVNTASLPVYPKKVRPIEKQGSMESRNLWRQVTNAIKLGDMSSATEFKQRLEERQRLEEQQRAAVSREWQPKYFIKQGEGWMYVEPLLNVQ